jgi:hypothetical protein
MFNAADAYPAYLTRFKINVGVEKKIVGFLMRTQRVKRIHIDSRSSSLKCFLYR